MCNKIDIKYLTHLLVIYDALYFVYFSSVYCYHYGFNMLLLNMLDGVIILYLDWLKVYNNKPKK
jgi:hypothetical protein